MFATTKQSRNADAMRCAIDIVLQSLRIRKKHATKRRWVLPPPSDDGALRAVPGSICPPPAVIPMAQWSQL